MASHDLGEITTVEDCRRVPVAACLESVGTKVATAILGAFVEVMGVCIAFTATSAPLGGYRYWLLCPHCPRRVGVLLVHPLTGKTGCRACLGVSYRAQRFKGMAEFT